MQAGLRNKLPNFMNQIPLAFPLQTQAHRLRLRTAGLDADYNEFVKGRGLYSVTTVCIGTKTDKKSTTRTKPKNLKDCRPGARVGRQFLKFCIDALRH